MTTPAVSPELARAADLLQTGQRAAAGRLLKGYLVDHPRDAEGWWLMSQAVSQPENVRTCLERVLRLRPDDARAGALLAQLDQRDEPDDTFFAVSAATALAPAAPAPAPEPAPRRAPTFTTGAPASFDPTLDLGVSFDPFAGIESEADPFAALRGQQAGTGNQPAWGPGLGFVSERPGSSAAPARRTGAGRKPSSTLIGVLVIGLALIVLVSALVIAARQRGWIKGGNLPDMSVLQAPSFSLDYPADWNGVCEVGWQGSPVCGISNDPRFNEVDYYTGAQVDAEQMLSSALSRVLSFERAPGLLVSVIAMDVPEDSDLYMASSQAAAVYALASEYPDMLGGAHALDYEESDPDIDGRRARVYRLTMENTSSGLESFVMGAGGDAAYYDVYIPHDGKMFWMTVQVYSFNDRAEIPHDIIEHMIESIDLRTS